MCYGSGCEYELYSGECGKPYGKECPAPSDRDREFEVEIYIHGTAYVTAQNIEDAKETAIDKIINDPFTGGLGYLNIEATAEEV